MSTIDQTYAQIAELACRHGVRRVILFGSRARGDELARSDIDIAVEGCPDFDAFEEDVQEQVWSLLSVDVVNLDAGVSQGLLTDIRRDGRVLYEKV